MHDMKTMFPSKKANKIHNDQYLSDWFGLSVVKRISPAFY